MATIKMRFYKEISFEIPDRLRAAAANTTMPPKGADPDTDELFNLAYATFDKAPKEDKEIQFDDNFACYFDDEPPFIFVDSH